MGLFNDVNRPTYEALFFGNRNFSLPSGETIGAAAAGGTQALDYALVRAEQTYVQNFLDRLPAERRANLIAQSNAALNGIGQPFGVNEEAQRLLGRPIDFGSQSDRELIGRLTVNESAASRRGN